MNSATEAMAPPLRMAWQNFLTTAIQFGDELGCNGVFMWQIFGLPPSKTLHRLMNKILLLLYTRRSFNIIRSVLCVI